MILRKQQQCTTYTGECVKKEHTRSPTLQHNKCRPHILLGPERPSGGRAPPQLPGLNNTKITEAEKEKENLSVMGVEIICRVKVCTSTLLLAFFLLLLWLSSLKEEIDIWDREKWRLREKMKSWADDGRRRRRRKRNTLKKNIDGLELEIHQASNQWAVKSLEHGLHAIKWWHCDDQPPLITHAALWNYF